MRQAHYNVRLPGWLWSLLLAVAALVRAASYVARPPADSSYLDLTADTLPYDGWAALLIVGAALVIVGVLLWLTGTDWGPWLAFVGHVILLGTVTVFVASLAITAATTTMGWAGLMPLVIVAILHTERILCIGTNIGRR